MRGFALERLAAAGLVWIALFSFLFTIGGALHVWPAPPEGGFYGTDLYAGLCFGAILLAYLAASGRQHSPDARLR